jgi:hypothetical protein
MRGQEQQAWAFTSGDMEVAALVGVGGGEAPCAPFLGVKALMLAILEDALRAYMGPVPSSHEEAAMWIGDARDRGVFSFAVVCETLGLEPGAVRAALRRMPIGPPRSRPNARRYAGLGIARPGLATKAQKSTTDYTD